MNRSSPIETAYENQSWGSVPCVVLFVLKMQLKIQQHTNFHLGLSTNKCKQACSFYYAPIKLVKILLLYLPYCILNCTKCNSKYSNMPIFIWA